MAFGLMCIYIFLSFVRVLDLYPELANLRLMLILGQLCLVISFVEWGMTQRKKRASFKEVQVWLTVVFFMLAIFGWCRIGWCDEAMESFNKLNIILGGFIMLVINLNSMKRLKKLVVVFVVSCVIMTVQGMAAYYYNWQRDLFVLEWHPPEDDPDAQPDPDEKPDPPRIRNLGFLNDPNDLAQTLAMAVPLIAVAWDKQRRARNWCLLFPVGAFLLFGIFLTHSRGGLVAVAVMILMALRERIGKIKAGILTTCMITVALIFNVTGGRAMKDESSEARIEAWASGIIMLRQNPVFGVNYGNFSEAHGRGITAHNSFVLCFAEMGLVGYFVWMSLLTTSYIEFNRLIKFPVNDPEDLEIRDWARGVRLAFTTFLAAAFFLSRTYILTLYMLIAFAIALEDITRRKYPQYKPKRANVWAKHTLAWQLITIALVWIAVKANGGG
jgi:putative inorganic carbon (HCO3(-)) transporter